MKLRLIVLAVVAGLLLSVGLAAAQDDVVELRMMFYTDGNEDVAMQELLDQFMEANPDIRVVLDNVAYADLHTILQAQVEAGDPPDLARITLVDRFLGSYLDLTDYVADPDYWTSQFPEPVLNSLREGEEDAGIYGYPTQFTVSGPYLNRTAFELAGVEVPSDVSDEVSWDEWEAAVLEVQEAVGMDYAFALDRTGHRYWTFSISQGANYFNEDGTFLVDTEGFRTSAERLIRWHEDGLMPPDVWGGAGGGYVAANEYFVNGQVIMYISGSWQVGQFAEQITDFDWSPIPNPTDVGGKCMMPGGAVMVSFAATEHPEEVGRLMDFLAGEDALAQFSEQSLFLPGHLGLAEKGLEYPSNNEALNVFLGEIPSICQQAYDLQYSPYTSALNTAIRDRLSQVIAGELTLDEGIAAIQEDTDEAIAAAE